MTLRRIRSSAGETPLTRQAEDYLKVIYEKQRDGQSAAATDIADQLGIAAASVSGMLPRLARLGLVKLKRYRGARLTEAERLKHAVSAELIDRMADALGNPAADPHGAPIPTSAGSVDERRLSSIADLPVVARERFDGSVSLAVRRAKHAIGAVAAGKVYVDWER
jgi:DtxR family Mn-dependent transcriptional regulator